MDLDFLKRLQLYVGNTSVGPSTARRMGPAGTILEARKFLSEIQLTQFEASCEADFNAALDQTTMDLKDAMPQGARRWGSARKFVNIFIRNCTYNRHICTRYKLASVEQWLEVPLDRHVAKGLFHDATIELPEWKTVIGLSPENSRIYQSAATEVARALGVHRVHLDLYYWRAVKPG